MRSWAPLMIPLLSTTVLLSQPVPISIIPKPAAITQEAGSFTLSRKTPIVCVGKSRELKECAFTAAEPFRKLAGFSLPVQSGSGRERKAIILAVNPKEKSLGSEGYRLQVGAAGVRVTAPSVTGIFYGLQSLLQLLPPRDTVRVSPIAIPAVLIEDTPRFPWRGMHLDVSRHFFPKEFVKTYIDMLAMHKMNTFHWHLTDDQGWRIEIKKYPELTRIGAWRVDRERLDWNVRTPQEPGEATSYGGFYTQDDIREIVRYAAARHITIVPEIEMPAHCKSALAAYPEFSCTGGPFTVPPGAYWPITDIYCAGNDSVFVFLQNILDEVIGLFPGPFIHIGGDEADKMEWKKCPKCQARVVQEKLNDVAELQSYFVKRIERFLISRGKRMIGWDEILEGGLAPEATVMSWRGIAGGIAAAREHHDVVMAPTDYCYFDYYQGTPAYETRAIGGYVPLKKVYSFEPVPDSLTEDETKHILGAQANLWTEFIHTPDQVQYMTLPRMAAMSEVVWSPNLARNWEDFARRVEPMMHRYSLLGYRSAASAYLVNFALTVDSATRTGTFTLETEIQPLDIRYTLDGSDPSPSSALYTKPFIVDSSVTVRAASFRSATRMSPVSEQKVSFHLASFLPVWYGKPYERFTAGGEFALTDGLRGTKSYSDGRWQGFHGVDVEVIIDLKKVMPLKRLSTGFLQNSASWIFLPKSVEFAASVDGLAFDVAGTVTNDSPGANAPDGATEYSLPLGNTMARFVRVIAKSVVTCPDWHAGKGQPAWTFIDEIVVE